MASGHVNRILRPNTWLHRPSLLREDSSCQPGAVHTWHKADIRCGAMQCPLSGVKRTLIRPAPMSAFDPKRTELAALAPDVILAVGSAGLPAVLQATQTVPIVFVVVPDPVGSGFVHSLSQPGGNA